MIVPLNIRMKKNPIILTVNIMHKYWKETSIITHGIYCQPVFLGLHQRWVATRNLKSQVYGRVPYSCFRVTISFVLVIIFRKIILVKADFGWTCLLGASVIWYSMKTITDSCRITLALNSLVPIFVPMNQNTCKCCF